MDKDTMIRILEARKLGERTRVLFDLLMDAIGADYEVKQHEVFQLIKKRLEEEEEAYKALTISKVSNVNHSVIEERN